MRDANRRERIMLVSEFVKIKGLMPLLMKHRNGDAWTQTERVELHEQLRTLSHLSPYLFVLLLPGSFALLPVLAWWLDRRRQQRQAPGDEPSECPLEEAVREPGPRASGMAHEATFTKSQRNPPLPIAKRDTQTVDDNCETP
ncbi:MAG: hypothetical protein HGA75_13455 [Thiobacillus sp.]|nr:hypothetical protein [Thiobacillus sp.]